MTAAPTVEQALQRARPATEGGAWVSVDAQRARRAAAQVDPDAPLAGWPVAVKDMLAVEGLPMQAGSRLFADAPPEPRDAAAVAALRDAGAVVLGTVALHELGLGVTGVNALGTPENPRRPGHAPGGSSSGSAVAVADGSARLALATDSGGSTRIPSALCAVVGFKPAYGTYPVDRTLALAPSVDHVGLIAARVDDVCRAHAALASPAGEAAAPGTIGLLSRQLERADAEVATTVEQAVRSLAAAGYRVREVEAPDEAEMVQLSATVLFFEAARVHAAMRDRWERETDPAVCARLQGGETTPREAYERALAERVAVAARVRETLTGVDVLVGPTVPIAPPTLADAAADPALPAVLVSNTRIANFIGLPALSLPAAEGVPVGLQIIGASNEAVLAHAAAMERILR